MTKKFRFTVELKAQIRDNPRGVKSKEIFERVRRLAQKISADDKALVEMYKVIFFDLLFGDYYSDEIRRKAKPKTEKELILPVAENMTPHDKAFFIRLFSEEAKEDLKSEKDNILDLFYSQFGNPKVVDVSLEISKNEEVAT
jgi:hypothetical protein